MVQILRITNRQASAIREPTAHTSDRHSTTIQVKKNRWGKDVRVTVHKRSSPLQWLVVSCIRIRLCLSLCYYKAHFSLQWYDVQAQIHNIYQLPSSPPHPPTYMVHQTQEWFLLYQMKHNIFQKNLLVITLSVIYCLSSHIILLKLLQGLVVV